MAQYLLWDNDGVIVDTEELFFEATQAALHSIGVQLPRELYLKRMVTGRTSWELARERGVSEKIIQEAQTRRYAMYQELVQTHPVNIPGAEEILTELATRHRMALVTTSRRTDLDVVHSNLNLLKHFEFILAREDYTHSKPNPEPYLTALNRFRAKPEEAMVIEDSERGLRSAIAAKIRCIVIKNAFTASQDFTRAWAILNSIDELPETLRRAGHSPRERHN